MVFLLFCFYVIYIDILISDSVKQSFSISILLTCFKLLLSYFDILQGLTSVLRSILTMFSQPFWVLNVSVLLLSMQGQKALGFHQKYFNLFSEDERRVWNDKRVSN